MTTKAAAADSSAKPQRRPVIALGDSHTRGFYGSSWLNILRPQFPHLQLINAGHDGEPSHSIAARLPALLKAHPNPAAVLIFAGSNDCIAQESEDLQWYYKQMFRLPELCSEQTALHNVEKMVEMVQQQAPKAKVIVINLPIMVEDPHHAANIRAHKFSTVLAQLVQQKYPSVSLVDFQSACRQHMAQHSTAWQQALQETPGNRQEGTASDPVMQGGAAAASGGATKNNGPAAAVTKAWMMTKYSLGGNMLWSKYVQSMLFCRTWDQISERQGLVLLTDQIHMNDTAAGILAGLVQPLLKAV